MASGYFSKLRHKILRQVCVGRSKTGAARLSAAICNVSKKSERQRFSVTSNDSDGPTYHLAKVCVIKKVSFD